MRDIAADERGVSLLYALGFMLVGVMASIVMLTAATTAVQRLHDDQQREQDLLTLDSAATLVRDYLAETSFDIQTVEEDGTVVSSSFTGERGALASTLKPAIAKAAGAAIDGGADIVPTDAEKTFTVEASSSVDAEGLAGRAVTVACTVAKNESGENEEDFRITAEFTLAGSDQRVFLVGNCEQLVREEPVSATSVRYTETVAWNDVKLTTRKAAV